MKFPWAPVVVVLGMFPLTPGCAQPSTNGSVASCSIVRVSVGTRTIEGCLVLRKHGHKPYFSPVLRVTQPFVSVHWAYSCPKRMTQTQIILGLQEYRRHEPLTDNKYLFVPLTSAYPPRTGHAGEGWARAHVDLRKVDRIRVTVSAGSPTMAGGTCSWRIMVAADSGGGR